MIASVWKREFRDVEKLKKPTWKLVYFLACIVLMLICAGFTSPLYPHYTGLDSSMFLITAKGIVNGKVAYADLFDHKGPVFFWIEALGYACGGRTGVWLLECLLAILDLLLLDRLCALFHAKRSTVIVPTAAVFFYLFQHGNLTEELSMPLILLGLYLELKFLASEEEKHSPLIGFVYGIILGLLAFIRLNNAIILCALLLCIAIVLIHNKQWGNLLNNLFLGILGLAVVTVPVCLYYYRHGALDDMLYATFLHNLIYAKNDTHDPILSAKILYYLILFAPGIYACIVYLKRWRSERSRAYASLLFATGLTYAMLAYTNVYAHYFMLGLPLFAVAVAVGEGDRSFADVWKNAVLIASKEKGKAKGTMSAFLILLTVVFAGMSAYSACAPIYKTYLTDIAYDEYAQVQKGVSVIPEEERDSVIAYDILANYYFHADIVPCYKYYTLQKWMTTDKVNVDGEFLNYVAEDHPMWVIIPTDENSEGIRNVLAKEYSCELSDDVYSYYRYCASGSN